MHDGKLVVAREPRIEGVAMMDWLLDFVFVALSLEERAKGTEIDAAGLEPLGEDSRVRQYVLH